MNNVYLILVAFVYSSFLVGQPVATDIDNVVMPAPTAAALGQYVDVPVSHYTGVPNINVPLYTIEEGPLSLPISMSYHGGGINVAAPSSWTGTGWSLQAGGIITRSIRGIFDDKNHGYQSFSHPLDINSRSERLRVGSGSLDSEPDIFSFNFLGYTGKFYFTGETFTSIVTLPSSDIEIEPKSENGKLIGFIIAGTDGTRYHFGKTDQDQPVNYAMESTDIFGTSSSYNSAGYGTSWYLTKIVSADHNYTINLKYTSEAYTFLTPAGAKQARGFAGYQGCDGFDVPVSPGGFNNPPRYITEGGSGIVNNFVKGYRLKSISTKNTLVNFEPGQIRQDLITIKNDSYNSPTVLDRVEIHQGGQLSESAPSVSDRCKKFQFTYDYFRGYSSPLVHSILIGFDEEHSYRFRLRLDAIQEISCDGNTSIPPHTFTYSTNNTKLDGYDYFPSRLSKAIDHWGYYNGKSKNNRVSNVLNMPPQFVRVENKEWGILANDINRYCRSKRSYRKRSNIGYTKATYASNRGIRRLSI